MDVALDKVRVKLLTRAMAGLAHVQPACVEAWKKRIGELPSDVGERYNNRLLTPRDWTSHFKNVLHRAMLTRSVTTGEACRCCGYARENLQHFADCQGWGGFRKLLKLTGLPELTGQNEKDRFGLFALHPKGRVLGGWINLHLLLWKHLIALLARVEEEGEKYAEHKIWAPTWIRFERKVLALQEKVDIEVRRSVSRGEPIRNMTKKSKSVEPLAQFTEDGDLVWNKDLVEEIKKLSKPSKGGRAGGENRNQA